jgi:transposase
MGKTYRPYLPEQDLLLPPSLRDWLPEGHLAYFVSDLIDELNLSAIESYYEQEERGYPPYHPRMMTKILVYGYCVGVFSSRRLQKRLHEDVAFRVLAADNQPDFRTLSDFRKIHLATLQGLFEQVLRMALELGALKLGRIAIDGSKIKGNASKHKAMSYKRMKEEQKRLKQEVRRLLKEAERIDAEEDARYGRNRYGDELPAELQRRETAAAHSRGQACPGSQGPPRSRGGSGGAGRRGQQDGSEAGRKRPVQLHRSGIAHSERAGRFLAGIQRPDCRRASVAIDRREGRHPSRQ